MASIDKRSDGRYRARWREYPGGPPAARRFDIELEADDWREPFEGGQER